MANKQTIRKMTNQNQQPQIERRYITEGVEFRKREDGKNEIFGYALKWDVRYNMGWFTESIDRNALANADLSDVRILLNHDPNQILGRTKAGTAEVGLDDVGMWYRASLPGSPNGENVRVALERGDITQSSWSFYTRITPDGNGDRWERIGGKDHRTITDVREVLDAAPVTYPANPDTSAAKRSRDFANIEPDEPTEQIEDKDNNSELELAEAELILAEV